MLADSATRHRISCGTSSTCSTWTSKLCKLHLYVLTANSESVRERADRRWRFRGRRWGWLDLLIIRQRDV